MISCIQGTIQKVPGTYKNNLKENLNFDGLAPLAVENKDRLLSEAEF